MLQLVNLSNYACDNELMENSPERLQAFLDRHKLDGLEMMFCGPWDKQFHKPEWLHGCHLRFWPWWLDFWRGNQTALLEQFGTQENINQCYGGPNREDWLAVYRDNIRAAVAARMKYMVFHVSHARLRELFNWRFTADSAEVIEATIEVVNALAPDIPQGTTLLFENLWWPGLTLTDSKLAVRLLDGVKYDNIGIMLDTGHLMNTNPDLTSEQEGVEYILAQIKNLGTYRQYIRGIHLHKSLSGKYLRYSQSARGLKADYTLDEVMEHVLKIDEHQPFTTTAVQKIINYVQPKFLVHEFMHSSMEDWEQKIRMQQQALGLL